MTHEPPKNPDEQIAIFRYGIIAPVLHDSANGQTRYFKDMANKTFDVPVFGRRQYNWKTFKSWLRSFRVAGFDGLKPNTRNDKGVSRRVDEHLAHIITQKFDEFPFLNVSGLYRMLCHEGAIVNGIPCENTVRKFVKKNKLKPQPNDPIPRKKFEKPHINELWLSDFMHGHYFIIDGAKRKLFLCGIIDDHSRLIVGARWTLSENTEALELTLKDAFLTYGLPKRLYCDNGAVYASSHLQIVCARLTVALLHSKPYDSPARGKIERFWRTVRDGFLPLVSRATQYSLEQFNVLFSDWLDKQYHRRIHHGIAQTPLDRYLNDAQITTVNRMTRDELDLYFYQTFTRRVKNDATVSLNATLFEVPATYIGANVQLRHPTGQPTNVWIYENDQPIVKIQPVDPVFNSSKPVIGIQYNQSQPKENKSC